MKTAKESLNDDLQGLVDRSERVGIMRERVRILDALHDQGPTGEFLELPWDRVLKIINPDAE